eukprot:Clim_evm7s152 gene=Clim_evmTU7s152
MSPTTNPNGMTTRDSLKRPLAEIDVMSPASKKRWVTLNEADDQRIEEIKPLIPPAILMEDIPLSAEALRTVKEGRLAAQKILDGGDDRLIVIVGPCSIHDPEAAIEYAQQLKKIQQETSNDLHIIMRVYFEKPRTTVGWKGLINDPDLTGTFQINKGLRKARKLLLQINEMGIPCGVEFLDVITPQYIADLVTWGAIGARTTESQVHRELSSGLSCPVGFKNGTSGDVQIAIDAIRSAKNPHHFLSVTKQGLAAIVCTNGNPYCHVILRGGSDGPNYERTHVRAVEERLTKVGLPHNIIIDCSHGNSRKLHKNQPVVTHEIALQVADGSFSVKGVMIESNINEGRQDLPKEGPKSLKHGVSITDACVSFEQTIPMLQELAGSVQKRRDVALKQ